jgi:hypothetical protein
MKRFAQGVHDLIGTFVTDLRAVFTPAMVEDLLASQQHPRVIHKMQQRARQRD